jgi:PKD repeat protein
MKKLFVFFSMLAIAAFMSVNLTSCGDDPMPVPTVKLLADIDPADQYKVNLTVQATDATSYAWDYGDGKASLASESHSYTYEKSGDYTITVTVTNESGNATATADVTINASIQEMLAGVDPAGKQWVLTKTPSANDGVGPLAPSNFDVITLPFSVVPGGDLLGFVGFPDEYDNIFTFKTDGGYSVNNVNGQNLCTAIKAMMTTGEMEPGNNWTMGTYGFASMNYAVNADAKWSVKEDATIEFDAMSEDPASTEAEPPLTPVHCKYAGVTQLSISSNGYFGLLDMTNYVIIEKISAEKLQVIIIMHTRVPDQPSMFARMTMVPKK